MMNAQQSQSDPLRALRIPVVNHLPPCDKNSTPTQTFALKKLNQQPPPTR